MIPRPVVLAIVLLIAALSASAQRQSAQPPSIFRTRAGIVEVDAPEKDGQATSEPPSQPSNNSIRLRPDISENVAKLAGNGTADAAARAGWEAYQRGDLESARASLAIAAANPEVEAWVHYALGQSEYALRQFKDAARSWETVRQRAPDFEPVYFDLVDAYLQLKEQDVAIGVLRFAEQRWPNDSEVFNALGVVQTSRGALDDAVKSFQQAIAKAPEDGIGYFNLAKVLELRYNRSRRYVQQTRTWVASSADHDAAIENYKRYLQIGGPFADSARDGLTRLQWTPK